MDNKISSEIPQSSENKEIFSINTIKQEFLTILDDFIEALKKSILVDPNRKNVDIVDDIFHPIAVKGDLTFNDFSHIFQKDLRTAGEVNTEILNEINLFVTEYGEFFTLGNIFRNIFQKSGNTEYIGGIHEYEVKILVEIIAYNLCINKCDIKTIGCNVINLFNKEKLEITDKLDNLSKIDLNIPGYIVFIIFRDILNEQENIGDFLAYASTIQNSFLTKDTVLGERIDDFFLKYSMVESTVDRVSEAVLNIRLSGESSISSEDIPY